MPSVEDVCSSFGLTDVQIKYTEQDFQDLSSYKLFQQHIRPLLAKDNPKVCKTNFVILIRRISILNIVFFVGSCV